MSAQEISGGRLCATSPRAVGRTDAGYPAVSVIVTARNAARQIGDCITALLDLDYPEGKVEIIVVDNGSRDATGEVARRFPVSVLTDGRARNSYAARNAGIRRADGEILAFTDADCVPTKGWLRDLVRGSDDGSIGCFAGEIVPYARETAIDRYLADSGQMSQKDLLAYTPLPRAMTANLAFRREVFRRIGLFDEKSVSGGDSEMLIRMLTRTDWRVRYNGDAVVFHKHRTKWLPFVRQFARYGWGEAWLVSTYAEQFHPRLTNGLCREAAEIGRGLGAFIRGVARRGNRGGERYNPLLDAVRLASWNVGLRFGLLYRMYLAR